MSLLIADELRCMPQLATGAELLSERGSTIRGMDTGARPRVAHGGLLDWLSYHVHPRHEWRQLPSQTVRREVSCRQHLAALFGRQTDLFKANLMPPFGKASCDGCRLVIC